MNQAQYTNEPEDLAEMTHPPIPPNCEYFREDCSLGVFFQLPLDARVYLCGFDDQNRLPAYRQIITAVARCAWLDEAAKFAKCPFGPKAHNLEDLIRWCHEANNIAEAWRIWGVK